MSRSWVRVCRRTTEVHIRVEELLMFAFKDGRDVNKIRYLCLKCAHTKSLNARTDMISIRHTLIGFGMERIIQNKVCSNGREWQFTIWGSKSQENKEC